MEHFAQSVVKFVSDNQAWMLPITFLLAFGESLAFISLILPSTVILASIAALLGAGDVGLGSFFWVWFAAGIGGALGYWVSYWIGYHFKDEINNIWPFRTRP